MENQTRPDSSFDAFLNYDVRHMIYEYLNLPPSSNESRGIALSCTSAYDEVRAAVVKERCKYYQAIEVEFCSKTSHNINIPRPTMQSTFCQLKRVVIEVPTALIHMMTPEKSVYDAMKNVLQMFYPLFTQPFDSVTIMLKDGLHTRSLRHDLHVGRFPLLTVIDGVAAIVNDASYRDTPDFKDLPRERHSVQPSPGGILSELISPRLRGYPDLWRPTQRAELPKTRRIAIAWDLRRPDGPKHVALTGFRHDGVNSAPELEYTEQDAAASRTESYALISKDCLVGETGIMSSNGWVLSSPAELTALYWSGVCHRYRNKCFSFGIGQDHYKIMPSPTKQETEDE